MSIILKALKSSSEGGGTVVDQPLEEGEGFFRGIESRPRKVSVQRQIPKKIYLVAGVASVLLVVIFLVWSFGNRSAKNVSIPANEQSNSVSLPDSENEQEGLDIGKKARAAFESGDIESSKNLFKQALAARPKDANLHNDLGFVYFKDEKYSDAAGEYAKALELNEGCAHCYNNLGLLKSELGEVAGAKEDFERAMSLNGSYPDPCFNLAVLYEKNGDIGNALKYYQQFITVYPDSSDGIIEKVKDRIAELTDK